MKIAQIAPLFESVPPKYYGGTERVVSHLTEQLVNMGHEVTLFASGDSVTNAELIPVWPHSLRLSRCIDSVAPHLFMLEEVCRRAGEFDIVHCHCDYLHLPLSRRASTPLVTTLHGRLDIPEIAPLLRQFHDTPFVSISDAQRGPLPELHWMATVHHGLPKDMLTFQPCAGSYLAFLGRIAPEKRPDRAIEIAQACGLPLKIAAKVDPVDQDYFEQVIKPLLELPGIEYVGEINDQDKNEFLGNALALLFPIDWPEPFGLVMIEAMACGTPVVAFNCGSVPEIVVPGRTGFVVENIDEAVSAVSRIGTIDRRECRCEFERRFTADRMASDYVKVYKGAIIEAQLPTTALPDD